MQSTRSHPSSAPCPAQALDSRHSTALLRLLHFYPTQGPNARHAELLSVTHKSEGRWHCSWLLKNKLWASGSLVHQIHTVLPSTTSCLQFIWSLDSSCFLGWKITYFSISAVGENNNTTCLVPRFKQCWQEEKHVNYVKFFIPVSVNRKFYLRTMTEMSNWTHLRDPQK